MDGFTAANTALQAVLTRCKNCTSEAQTDPIIGKITTLPTPQIPWSAERPQPLCIYSASIITPSALKADELPQNLMWAARFLPTVGLVRQSVAKMAKSTPTTLRKLETSTTYYSRLISPHFLPLLCI